MFLERENARGRARALIPAGPKIYAHLPYVIKLDDELVRTRDNALMISLEVISIDGGTSCEIISALRAGSCISSTRWMSSFTALVWPSAVTSQHQARQ